MTRVNCVVFLCCSFFFSQVSCLENNSSLASAGHLRAAGPKGRGTGGLKCYCNFERDMVGDSYGHECKNKIDSDSNGVIVQCPGQTKEHSNGVRCMIQGYIFGSDKGPVVRGCSSMGYVDNGCASADGKWGMCLCDKDLCNLNSAPSTDHNQWVKMFATCFISFYATSKSVEQV